MSHAVSRFEGTSMETEETPRFGLIEGEGADTLAPESGADRYPDFEFDLTDEQIVGNGVIDVTPQRRLIRVLNAVADVVPGEFPHITPSHHLLNHLKRELNKPSRDLSAVREAAEIFKKQNHPVVQMIDQLEKYKDDERIHEGDLRALQRDVLIVAEHVARTRKLGQAALDTTAETE